MRFAVLILPVLIVGCRDSSPTVPPNVTPEQQTIAAQSMGIAFPPSTRFLFFDHVQGMDDAIWLKIELPAADLDQFLSQTPFATESWGTARRWVDDMKGVVEWTPSTASRFRSKQFQLPIAEVLNVLIDDSREEQKVIYLMWHET